MANNSPPEAYDPIIQLLEDTADGAHTHGAELGVTHNNEAKIRLDLTALVGTPAGPDNVPPAVPGLKALWNSAQAAKSAQTAALRTVQSNSRFLARTCVRSLFPVLGENWNAQWQDAGFTGGSLAIPANPLATLQQLRAYFAANPARETPNIQGIACTAAACETAAQAISTAASNSLQSNTDAGEAHKDYLAGLKAARTRLTNLRDELSQLMPEDDDRWYAFGFEKPSDSASPETPENLVFTPGAPGSRTFLADWDDARRADNYRLRAVVKATGVQVFNEIVQDSDGIITLPALPAGTELDITVTARNATGESQPTAAITGVLP
ncbi:MAG: hypothetical protein RL514_4710 [Verrucomicrobiota bacterium]|jgi:hypothetical protein